MAVPDDMANERLEELMQDLVGNGTLDLNEEEREDDGISVDIADFPSGITAPHLTLRDDGLVDEDAMLSVLTTDRLQAELERRRAKESHIIAV